MRMQMNRLQGCRAAYPAMIAIALAAAGLLVQAQTSGPAPLVATAFGDANPSQPYIAIQQPKIPGFAPGYFARAYLGDGLLGIPPEPEPTLAIGNGGSGFRVFGPKRRV